MQRAFTDIQWDQWLEPFKDWPEFPTEKEETEADNLTDLSRPETTDFSRIELEQGGRLVNESSFSVLNVTGATVIPFGKDIGRATSLNIVEHGINLTIQVHPVNDHHNSGVFQVWVCLKHLRCKQHQE